MTVASGLAQRTRLRAFRARQYAVRFPEGQSTVTIHHADGTGFSKKLSFEEAFANARADLPPAQSPVADSVERIQVLEIGALYGGIAGFRDMFVRICPHPRLTAVMVARIVPTWPCCATDRHGPRS